MSNGNRTWLDIPESDYQADEPVARPIEIRLLYADPILKEQTNRKTGNTFMGHYYGVDFNGAEYTISASAGLHKQIQAIGGTRDTKIKIIKKRIGPEDVDIRWSVSVISGPIDQDKIDMGNNTQPGRAPVATSANDHWVNGGVQAAKPAGTNTYYPLRDDEGFMALAKEIAGDKLAVWNLIYERVVDDYPEEDSEWHRQLTTHLNIDIQKEMHFKIKDGYAVAKPPPELSEREKAIVKATLSMFVQQVANGHENLTKAKAGDIVKKFGFTHLPPDDKDAWLNIAKIVWRYQDRIDQGMNEFYSMTGTADEFELPYEVMDLPPDPDAEEDDDEIPF